MSMDSSLGVGTNLGSKQKNAFQLQIQILFKYPNTNTKLILLFALYLKYKYKLYIVYFRNTFQHLAIIIMKHYIDVVIVFLNFE